MAHISRYNILHIFVINFIEYYFTTSCYHDIDNILAPQSINIYHLKRTIRGSGASEWSAKMSIPIIIFYSNFKQTNKTNFNTNRYIM